MITSRPHCAGIIVFDGNRTVLVCTPKGNFSFPKGKLNKDEPEIVGAWREIREETGLSDQNVKLIENIHFDEYTAKGNLSIRYFIGTLINNFNNFIFDSQELYSVGWYDIDKAIEFNKMKKQRREILLQAHKFHCNYITNNPSQDK